MSKEGRLTLVQIALSSGVTYIFDIYKGGSIMFEGFTENKVALKFILENGKIIKLIHDIRSDWAALFYQYDITINNFIDTQEAFFVKSLIFDGSITLPIGLSKLLVETCGVKLSMKDKMKKTMSTDFDVWIRRPLDDETLQYAAEDVYYLHNVWDILSAEFNDNLKELVIE